YDVLDIGCGIGILGIAAAKLFDANIVMSDINERAVMLAKKNIKLNNIEADIFQGNLYEKINKNDFDVVLTNPPQTAGKEICFQLIDQSKNHLKSNGTLQLVARHNKGGKTLSKKMQEVFGNVKVIAKKAGYWVYFSKKQ
ncbi:MAG TPA: methyltransferase, partial [Candidatus Nanoarchaeia archaeon]|nr:methyltransferase [Candidatus Nanoarchaeia archaeon]